MALDALITSTSHFTLASWVDPSQRLFNSLTYFFPLKVYIHAFRTVLEPLSRSHSNSLLCLNLDIFHSATAIARRCQSAPNSPLYSAFRWQRVQLRL